MGRPTLSYCGHRHDEPRPGAPALALDGVSVSYPDSTAPALSAVTIEFPVGGRVAIVGPNGSGKSTLLKTAAGLLRPSLGRVRVLGQPPDCLHHRIAYLPQRSDLDWRRRSG